MLKILIDTCVWLELAKDYRNYDLIQAVGDLRDQGMLQVILPRLVVEEFDRNKERVLKAASASQREMFKRARAAVRSAGLDDANEVSQRLGDVEHAMSINGQEAGRSVALIAAIFDGTDQLEPTDSQRLRALQRGLEGRKPYSRTKNSTADAILIEMFSDLVAGDPDDEFAFITVNHTDFSDSDHRLPHPDIADIFNERVTYSLSLEAVLSRPDGGLFADIDIEEYFEDEPRLISEIGQEISDLIDIVWYGRHMSLRSSVLSGRTKVVLKEDYKRTNTRMIREDIWEGALKAAEEVEKRLGKDRLGPHTDFEWGMINGKLSALRWVLGHEWDMLDT